MLRQWGTVIVPYSYFNEMDMKVTVIMEKASDGYYSCFVEENLPDFGLAGYGDTAEAAKKDMMKAYEEIKEMQAEEDKEVPELEFTYKYDMQSFFNYFSFLNVTKVAELAVGDACTGSNPRSIDPEQMAKLLKCCFYDEEVTF